MDLKQLEVAIRVSHENVRLQVLTSFTESWSISGMRNMVEGGV